MQVLRAAPPILSCFPQRRNSKATADGDLIEPLSQREIEVLQLLAQGMRNKEIAAKLFISPETVKKHLNNIYGKLNISNRRQAVDKAETLGILTQR